MKSVKTFKNLCELEEAIILFLNKRYEVTQETPSTKPIDYPLIYEQTDEIGEVRLPISKKKNANFLRISQIIKEKINELPK